MKRPGPALRLTAPLKLLAQRFTFLGLVAASVALMVLARAEAPLIERLRMTVVDAVLPILDAAAAPLATAERIGERISGVVNVYAENVRLREENERLLRWQAVAQKLEADNRSLRELTNLTPEAAIRFVSARVVANAGGAFFHTVLVTAGARDGVRKGQAAITGEGLAGRVTEVGERSARVLLLTDLNSQVPVVLHDSRIPAVLAGDNSDRPRLIFLPPGTKPQVGDRLATSGRGGVLPAGLPVGVVDSVDDGAVRVRTFADPNRLEHLRIVDYGLEGTLTVGAPPPLPRRGAR